MKKRGEITLWFWVELVGAILIFFLAVDVALSRCQGTIYEKRNIAGDISAQINALSGVPGDSYIVNNNLHGYSLRFFNNRVEVFEGVSDQFRVTSYFVKIGNSDINLALDKPNQVVISKIGNEIKISQNIPNLS